MRITADDLIEQFYNQMEDKHSLSLEQVTKICKSPFNYFREKMALHELPLIKVKYLGKFMAYRGSILRLLSNLTNKYRLGKMSKESFEDAKNNLHLYLDKNFNNEKTDI